MEAALALTTWVPVTLPDFIVTIAPTKCEVDGPVGSCSPTAVQALDVWQAIPKRSGCTSISLVTRTWLSVTMTPPWAPEP